MGIIGDSPYRARVTRHAVAWSFLGVFWGAGWQQVAFVVEMMGGSPSMVAAVSTGPSAFAVLMVIYARMYEGRSARRVLGTHRVIGCVLFGLCALSGKPLGIAVAAILGLIVFKAGDTFYGRLVAEMYPTEVRGRMLSAPMFMHASVAAVVSLGAGWALRTWPRAHHWVLAVAAVAGVASALIITRVDIGPEAKGEEGLSRAAPFGEVLREIARDRGFVLWLVVYSVTTAGYWLIPASLPVYLHDVLGLGYLENGVAAACFSAMYCLGFLVWGRVLDRVRSVRTMIICWAAVAVGTLVTVLGPSYGLLLAGRLICGFALAGNDMAWYPVVLEFAPRHAVDRYMGVYMTVFGLRAIFGGLLSGAMMEMSTTGSRAALLTAAIIMAVGVVGIAALRARLHRPEPS